MVIQPDTRTRLALADLSALSFEGAAGPLSVRVASDPEPKGLYPNEDGAYDVSVPFTPCLVTCSWVVGGATVSAQLDVVSRRICPVADVKAYRADQYQIAERCTDDQVQAAINRAEEVIETECRRHLQPVMRTGYVDRGTCPDRRYRNMVMGEGGYQTDLIAINSAVDDLGREIAISQVRDGSDWVDVTSLSAGGAATLSFTCGLSPIPAEAHDAVMALAALYLAPGTEPDNATSMSTDAGVLNFVIGGVNGATSVPEVNALISRWGLRKYVVG